MTGKKGRDALSFVAALSNDEFIENPCFFCKEETALGKAQRKFDKGSGMTSIVQGLNTKRRQRQSGKGRCSCGVHPKMAADLHKRQSTRRCQRRQDEAEAATQSNP